MECRHRSPQRLSQQSLEAAGRAMVTAGATESAGDWLQHKSAHALLGCTMGEAVLNNVIIEAAKYGACEWARNAELYVWSDEKQNYVRDPEGRSVFDAVIPLPLSFVIPFLDDREVGVRNLLHEDYDTKCIREEIRCVDPKPESK